MAELNWSDAQWQKVNDCVTEAFGKASVASAFLPCYGPLAGSTETVRNERLHEDLRPTPPVITLDAYHPSVNLRFVNLTVKVELSSEQVADETLANAMLAFRRAANILAQGEDKIVFDGFVPGVTTLSAFVNSTGVGAAQMGLADGAARLGFDPIFGPLIGTDLVRAVVKAIRRLEDRFHSGPFACVMGNELFDAAHDPSFSLVLPADRITPLLKGPLLRSGQMYEWTGIVVSLAGNAIDIVVGTPPTVQFLQRREDARFVFRVYERFVLRVRDTGPSSPVAGFEVSGGGGGGGAKGKKKSAPRAASPSLAEAGLEDLTAKIHDGVELRGRELDKKSSDQTE
jgi:uncharacterized linocin/CFP29 family protein